MKSADVRAIVDALRLVDVQNNFSVSIATKHGMIEYARKKFEGCQPYISFTTYVWGGYLEVRTPYLFVDQHNGTIGIRAPNINSGISVDDIQCVSIGEPYDCLHRIVVYRKGEC